MPYGKAYTGSKFSNPHGKSGKRYAYSTAHWKEGMSYADCLRRYPMGPEANPMTNDHRKRASGSRSGMIGNGSQGAAVGGAGG